MSEMGHQESKTIPPRWVVGSGVHSRANRGEMALTLRANSGLMHRSKRRLLFDHLVGKREQRWGHGNPSCNARPGHTFGTGPPCRDVRVHGESWRISGLTTGGQLWGSLEVHFLETRLISVQLAPDGAVGWIVRRTPNDILLNVAVDRSNREGDNDRIKQEYRDRLRCNG
jgi:hypothetical protein